MIKKIILFFIIIIISIVLLYAYAYFIGTSGLKRKEYRIKKKIFIKEYNGFKIAHISDLHYGNHMPNEKVKKLVEDVNSLNPDLIFITGDLVDDKITKQEHKELVDILKNLKASINIYTVNGNHDTYYNKYDDLISEMGFVNMKDSYEKIYLDENNFIFLAGLSDSIFNPKSTKDRFIDIDSELSNSENMKNCILKILLIHEPDYIESIAFNKFDLIFSGHSHNGQVRLPIIGSMYEPIGAKKYYDEHYNLGDTDLYISSGVGLSWLPIRLFNRPSYNLYRITK